MRWTKSAGQEQRDLTRRRITEAARTCFYKQGLNETSVDQIAKAAGVGRATLYLHFPNKEAIVLAILSSDLRGVRAIYSDLCTRKPIDEAAVKKWLIEYVSTLRHNRDAMRLFRVGLANEQESRALIDDHHEAIIAMLAEHFESLRAEGTNGAYRHAYAMLVLMRVDHFAGAAAGEQPRIDMTAGLDIVCNELLCLLQPKMARCKAPQ
jgi:AcrR family transcriptional regulator